MTKIALITDTHLGVRNDSPVFLENFRKSAKFFFDYLDTHGIDRIIHLGDLYDRRKYINFATAKTCRESFLEEIQNRLIPCYVMPGNHDVMFKDTNSVNALDELLRGRYPYTGIVNTPYETNIDDCKIIMIPWITKDNYDECMEAIKNTTATILCGHLELIGFEMHKGHIAEHGMDKNIFSKFDRVFSGHYHHRSESGNITYLGAFGYYTWADYNDYRGFAIFDTETQEVEYIQNPICPFKIINYDETNPVKEFAEYQDCYVKVQIKNRENLYLFDLFMDKLYEAKPADISIIEDDLITIANDEDVLDGTEDTGVILSKYIDGLKLQVDTDKMKRYMSDVYTEALSVEHV